MSLASLTDAQARQLVIKALRQARATYRKGDTAGEKYERELDRLIKRKTRINVASLQTALTRYKEYNSLVDGAQVNLTEAARAAAQF